MHIAIASLGSRGDFQPMAALAAALARRGHDTRLIGPQGYEGLSNEPGVDFRTVDYDVREELLSVEGRQLLHSGRNVAAGLRAVRAIGRRNFHNTWSGLAEHTQGAQLLVCELTSWGQMQAIAEQRGLPFIPVLFQPRAATRAFPHPFAQPSRRVLPGWANRLHHHLIEQLLWQTMRSLVNDGRRDVFGLQPWPFFGPYAQFQREARPVLMAFSRHVVPRPAEWHAGIEVTGYWFLDRSAAWQPPADLVEFLETGPPPVYVGFGSMALGDPEAIAALVLAAIDKVGCRAVIAAGWGGLSPKSLPPNVFALEEAPHDWLFPRMAAVVHHGGAGTTAATLRAGVPSVVVPFMGDQFFWAQTLARKGVAPNPVPHARLRASTLSQAITLALGDDAMRQRVAALGALIREEDGLGRAAARIEAIGAT